MVDSINGVANLAIAMQQQKIAQQTDIAVFKKVQDVQEQQGQAVMQLIDSAQVSSSGIDIKV